MFNPDKYKKTGWVVSLVNLEQDNYLPRLIVRVATGRKYWPLFTEVINTELKTADPTLERINNSLYGYTHPMIDRLIEELDIMLSDVYDTEIKLQKPKNHLK